MSWLPVIAKGVIVGRMDVRQFWPNWRVWLMAHALNAITTAATWILLGRLLESDGLVEYLLIGQVGIIGPRYAGWAVQSFTWDRMFVGTYPLLVAAPSSLVPVMIGRTSVWLMNGIATSIVMLLTLLPLFRVAVRLPELLAVVALLIVVCASAYGFAFFLGALVNWLPRARNVIHNAVFIVMAGICGVTVPVTFWPDWVQALAKSLPVTHGLQAIRVLLDGGSAAVVGRGVILEIVVGLVWFALGAVTIDWTVAAARRNGAVELL